MTATVEVRLDEMGRQLFVRLATVGPIVKAAIDHVRFPTDETMAALDEAVNTYLRVFDDEAD